MPSPLGIRRKPVLPIDLFAISRKRCRKILVSLTQIVRHIFAAGHDNLKFLGIHPDLALKVPFVLLNRFGGNVEDIAGHLVDGLAAHVFHVILADILLGKNERQTGLNILKIRGRHADPLQAVARRVDHLLRPFAPMGQK